MSLPELKEAVSAHVREGVGTSNKIIESFARQLCGPYFAGVFAADCIPRGKISRMENFILIVNLGEKKGENREMNGHFVTICACGDDLHYWDPYAFPCLQPKVKTFLQRCGRKVVTNGRRVQHLESVYCGFYCLLYAAYQARCMAGEPPKFKLRFYKIRSKLLKNDSRCVEYLHRLIDQMHKLNAADKSLFS